MSFGSIPLALAFLLSVALVAALCRIAPRIGLIDIPTVRKAHEGTVPVCGGIAMFVALLATMALRDGLWPRDIETWATAATKPNSWTLLLALGALVAVGIADDRWEIRAGTKLALQGLIACVLLGLGDGGHLGAGMVPIPASLPANGWISALVTIVFVVGLINAFNMIDGLDGLAGGIAGVALICLALASMLTGQAWLVDDSLLLVAVVLGFLVFNLRRPGLARAIAFMGDAGSMMLGCAIGSIIVELSSRSLAGEGGPEIFPALLWIVAIPVIDTISLMIRRPLAGRSPMAADRAHLHHLLLDSGMSPMLATATLIGVSGLLGAVAIAGIALQAPASLMLMGLAIPAMGHCAFVWAGPHRRKAVAQAPAVSPEPAE
jgi:UDP-GlcNAc:undecaprenyl-phosphate GlcNAc-1-phosphate transferase